ncbi:MAG: hypothetical protein HC850_02520 [Rhodomicrobium sp.]|nr:hypothetical protein [Rhodomicrobium sp.]
MSKLTFSATFIAAAMTLGIMQTAPAGAMPNPQTSIAKTVKADGVQLVRGHRHRGGHAFRHHGPGHRFKGAGRIWKPGKWCKNHPRRCFAVHRSWRWCKNHPRRCAGYRGWGYVGGGASLCHRHIYPVPGMAFHANVRCNHRHYRAYDSWEWVN